MLVEGHWPGPPGWKEEDGVAEDQLQAHMKGFAGHRNMQMWSSVYLLSLCWSWNPGLRLY